jgi:hydrogenase maturation protein HypF
LDWRPVIRGILDDLSNGVPQCTVAMRFHRSLANGIGSVARRFSDHPIVLCGGCFYNRVLTELVAERISPESRLGTPGVIPVGDGGLAAGQLAVAAARLTEAKPCA